MRSGRGSLATSTTGSDSRWPTCALQLDHIVERDAIGDPVTNEIGELREDVRG